MRSSDFLRGYFCLAAVLSAACMTSVPAQAATQPVVKDNAITLSVPGLVGNSTTVPNGPVNAIEVLAMSLGGSNTPVSQHGSGIPNISFVSVAKATDAASPKLFLDMVQGALLGTITFQFWERPTSGTAWTKTYTIILANAYIVTTSISAAEGGGPAENLSFAFQAITFQDNVSGTVSCYNVSTNTASNGPTC